MRSLTPKVYVKKCRSCDKTFKVGWEKRGRSNCDECTATHAYVTKAADAKRTWLTKTIGQLKEEHTNKHKRPWTDRVRSYARATYSDKSPCVNCQYSLHVEVCHKQAIVDFPDSSTIADVNHPDNILFLCRNCHWEFDSGLLDL